MKNETKVSIGVVTYNQENFIRKALDSILMQKTNFKFEILINDDCSTDNTAKIIKEYEEKYPDIIKPIYQTKNQYSKGINVLKEFIFKRVNTQYYITNEGDDYFIDPYKLQKQVDYMEQHPECSMCFHPVKIVYENKDHCSTIFPTFNKHKPNFTFEHLLKENFIQTNTAMYRWDLTKEEIANTFQDGLLPGDWYAHLVFASKGQIGFIDEVMAVYRRNDGGIWSHETEELHRIHGIKELKFYNSVYKLIAKDKETYKNEVLLPNFKMILDNYYKFRDYDKLTEIKNLYPETINSLSNFTTPIENKLKKYKKLYTLFIILAIVLLVSNLIWITLFFMF